MSVTIDAERLFAGQVHESPEELDILLADLEAAAWCEAGEARTEAFVVFHHRQTARIRGSHVDFMKRASREHLESVVRRWAELYRRALAKLRASYPIAQGRRLMLRGVAWSDRLGISVEGIANLPTASRYAEYWAEQSLEHPEVEQSYEARLAFLSTADYDHLFSLAAAGELLVYEHKGLAVTLFDVAEICRSIDPQVELIGALMARGLAVNRLSPRAQLELERLRGASSLPTNRVTCHRVRTGQLLTHFGLDPLFHPAARAHCQQHPREWAWATSRSHDASISGWALTHVDNVRRASWVVAGCSVEALMLLRELRDVDEFQRVTIDPLFLDEARSVFPNLFGATQPVFVSAPSAKGAASLASQVVEQRDGAWRLLVDGREVATCRWATYPPALDFTDDLLADTVGNGQRLLEYLARHAHDRGRRLVVQAAQQVVRSAAEAAGLTCVRSLLVLDYHYRSWHEQRRAVSRAARAGTETILRATVAATK